jgi:hypothetical protein
MTLLTMATTGAPLAASVVPLVVSVVGLLADRVGDTLVDSLVVDAVVDELVVAVVGESRVDVVVTLFVNLVVDEKLGNKLGDAREALFVCMSLSPPFTNIVLDMEKVSQLLVVLQQLTVNSNDVWTSHKFSCKFSTLIGPFGCFSVHSSE